MIVRYRARQLARLACALALLTVGCKPSIKNDPVDSEKAINTLRTALDSWKKGEKFDAMQKATPPIYVIDTEWESGAVLVNYQLVSDGDKKDAQLFCPVKLTIRNASGKEEEKKVTYMISTAPNLTVSRKVF